MTKTLSVAETKARLSEVIHEVEAHGGPIVITRRGRPVAVIEGFTVQTTGKNLSFERLFGQLAEIADFDRIMKHAVRSRTKAGTRPVDSDRITAEPLRRNRTTLGFDHGRIKVRGDITGPAVPSSEWNALRDDHDPLK